MVAGKPGDDNWSDGSFNHVYLRKIDATTGNYITFKVETPVIGTADMNATGWQLMARGSEVYFYMFSTLALEQVLYKIDTNGATNWETLTATPVDNTIAPKYSGSIRGVTNCQSGASKSASANLVKAGDTITYTLSLVNGTDLNYTGVTFADTLPPEVTFVPGTVILNGTVLPTADPTVAEAPNFANGGFVKTVDKTNAEVGDTLTYIFNLENAGAIEAENVVITDPLASSVSYVSGSLTGGTLVNPVGSPSQGITVANIPAGGTATVTFDVTITSGNQGDIITNFGILDYDYTSPLSNNPLSGTETSDNVFTTIGQSTNGPNLSASTKSGPTTAIVGDTITYTITLINAGNEEALNISVTDVVSTNTTFVANSVMIGGVVSTDDPATGITVPNIAAGGITTVTFDVVDTIPAPNPMINQGIIAYEESAQNPIQDITNVLASTVENKGALLDTGTKTVSNQLPTVGDTIVYTVTLPNTGDLTATGVLLKDTLATGMVFQSATVDGVAATGDPTTTGIVVGDIAAGNTATVEITVLIESTLNPNPFLNMATAEFDNGKGDTVNQIITGPAVASVEQGPADLSSSLKSVSNAMPTVGDVVTYTIFIFNTSAQDATNVLVKDVLATGLSYVAGSATVSSVAAIGDPTGTGIEVGTVAGSSVVPVTFQVSVDAIPNPNPFVNIADIEYENGTGAPVADTVTGGSIDVQQGGGANLGNSTKSTSATTAQIGETITYTINVENTGTTKIDGTVAADGPITGIAITTLAPNTTAVVTFDVLVSAIPTPNPYTNTADIAYVGVIIGLNRQTFTIKGLPIKSYFYNLFQPPKTNNLQ